MEGHVVLSSSSCGSGGRIGGMSLALFMFLIVVPAATAQLKVPANSQAEPSPQAAQRMVDMAERIAGVDRQDAVAASSATPEVVVAPIESTPLGQAPPSRRSRLGTAGFGDDGDQDDVVPPSSAWSGGSILSTLAALGVVIALIFGVRFLLARATKTPMVSASSAVEVLSRTSVAPRSHVLLLRVGPQVLVVGESSGGLRTLSTVQDEQDVATLLQAVESSKPQSIAGGFSSLMGKFNGQYEQTDTADPLTAPPIDRFEAGLDQSEAPVDRARHGLSALAGRLRVRGGAVVETSGGKA
ncbi:MAG: flagellar biosynthetic protein FliO [Planctomycetota bacterium]